MGCSFGLEGAKVRVFSQEVTTAAVRLCSTPPGLCHRRTTQSPSTPKPTLVNGREINAAVTFKMRP